MQVRLKSCSRAHEAVSMPERPRAATGLEPDVSRMPPRFLPLQWRLWLTARPTAPHHAGSSTVSGWFLRAATAAADGAEPLRDVASGARAREPRATRPPASCPITSPDPTVSPERALTTSDPSPHIPSAGHDEPRYRWSGHRTRSSPGAFARHPSLSRLECRVGNRGTPPHDNRD